MVLSKGKLIAGIAVGVLVFILAGLYFYTSSLKTEGVGLETELSAQYSRDQAEYSAYAAGLIEQLGVAETKMDKVKDLVAAYVSGRKTEGGGSLLLAVQEAVPDLKSAEIYDKIVAYIQAGRQKFKAKQDKLISQIQVYESWQSAGLIRPAFIRFMGFPTDNLRATIGGNSVHGQAALDQMRILVTTAETKKAFETGEDKPLVGGDKKNKK